MNLSYIKDYLHKGFKYAVVGSSGALINWVTLYYFTSIVHIWYLYSAVISSAIVMIVNFNLFIAWKVIRVETK